MLGEEEMRLISVTKQYEKRIVLGGLSLEIPDGKVTCVLGKSGAGKTTTLNVICGMTDFEGIVENAPSRVGYVFQEDRLIPHMSICENLQFVGGRDEIIKKMLPRAGLQELKDRRVCSLSGGEKRRVEMLRAFCVDAPVVLLDEPFSALDTVTKWEMLSLMKELLVLGGQTAVFVTHDLDEAVAVADKIAVLHNGKIAYERLLDECSAPRSCASTAQVREELMEILKNL